MLEGVAARVVAVAGASDDLPAILADAQAVEVRVEETVTQVAQAEAALEMG